MLSTHRCLSPALEVGAVCCNFHFRNKETEVSMGHLMRPVSHRKVADGRI